MGDSRPNSIDAAAETESDTARWRALLNDPEIEMFPLSRLQ